MSQKDRHHLPATWADDDEMSGLMTMIKNRSANPIDHDRKIRFWSGCIETSCIGEKNALFNIEILKRRFQRGNQIPASLSTVIQHMCNNDDVVSVGDWREKHSSWVGWGVSRLAKTGGWLFGSSNNYSERYIHLPTVKKQAQEILQLYANEFKDEVDCTGEVVAYDDIYDKALNIVKTKENFDIIMDQLIEQGDVTVGVAKNGDKILKFRDVSDDGPVRFTEADASVHDIRKAMGKLDKEIRALEGKIQKLDGDTRTALRAGEKVRATNLLRQKKRAEKDMSDKDGQYQKLLTMLHQLGSTKHNRDVLDAFKTGTQAFKANLERHGLSPDKIDSTMDEVQNAVDDYREIEEAMGQSIGIRDPTLDEDLERELESLVSEQKKKESATSIRQNIPVAPTLPSPPKHLPELPAIPSSSSRLGISREDSEFSSVSSQSLEERLNRLRALAD